MAEYIKREDALDAVLFSLVGTGHQSQAIYAIRDVPAADVAEVKRAKWECVNESDNVWMCTGADGYGNEGCGSEIILLEGTPHDNEWNYCPNCGAKMDGGNAE